MRVPGSEAQRLEDSIRLSRRYWGSPFLPLYWQLASSLAWHRFNRAGRAHRHQHAAQELVRHRHMLQASPHLLAACVLAPDIAFYAGVYPHIKHALSGTFQLLMERLAPARHVYPQTAVYMDRTMPWEDGWAGPRLNIDCEAAGGEQTLVLRGTVHTEYMSRPQTLTVALNGKHVGQIDVLEDGYFSRQMALPAPLPPGRHSIEIQASTWVVYHRFLRNGDYRPLAWLPAGLDGVALQANREQAPTSTR